MQAGGQRLVQTVCYLDTLAPQQGGGTRFAHPALKGLTVQVLLPGGRGWGGLLSRCGAALAADARLPGRRQPLRRARRCRPRPCPTPPDARPRYCSWRPLPPARPQPRQGDCLLFFPAFADGRLDGRMAHEGLPVAAGEKWIINVSACKLRVGAS